MQLSDQLTNNTISFLMKEPFYAHLLSGINKVFSKSKTNSIALAEEEGYWVLYFNPEWWAKQGHLEDQHYNILKHQALHLIFAHPIKARDYKCFLAFNIAADLVVQQFIEEKSSSTETISIEHFKSLNLEPDQSTDYYYEKMAEALETSNDPYLAFLKINQARLFESHQPWFTEKTKITATLSTRNLNFFIKTMLLKAGTNNLNLLPEKIKTLLLNYTKPSPSKANWRKALRTFAESSSRTYLKNSHHRPSKRYGTTPGIKIRRRQRLIIALDTSGSISQEQVQLFFEQIYFIWKRGATIKIVECDDRIRSTYEFKGQLPDLVKGRGNTNFDPVMEYTEKYPEFDGLIYFTDGSGNKPLRKNTLPVLWAITGRLWNKDLPGKKIIIQHG